MWVEKNGPTYRIREEVAGKKIDLAIGYPTKAAAQDAMILLRADQIRGDALVPRGDRATLDEFLDEWWPTYERTLKPSTVKSESARMRNHIRPILGEYELGDIDAVVVQEWVNRLEKGDGPVPAGSKWVRRKLAPKTVHNCHGLLFVIMQGAVARRRVRMNPCASTHLPARVQREMRFLTDPEIGRLVQAAPKHWRPLIVLLVGTGLRWGEAIGLKVGRVDLLAKRPKLLVVEQLQELSSEMIFVSPKSVKSRRTVSFTTNIALMLTPLVANKEPGDMVFVTPTGLWVRTRNFRRVWLTICKAAGLDGLRVHDLRHTHAALLIAANRQMSAISRRLGHSSIAVTDALYGHLREEVDEGILAAIEDSLAHIRAEDFAAEIADELADELGAEVDDDEMDDMDIGEIV